MNHSSSDQYADDGPIQTEAQDRFSRWRFAERTAQVLANRKDESSLVIGIYGPWGDGKTSVLNMMAATLAKDAKVVTIRFNPWYFDSESHLIQGFFEALADAAGKSLATVGQKIGEALTKYGGILSVASVSVPGGLELSLGDAAQAVGEELSHVGLDELKDRLDKQLIEAGKRIVVLIDDVDRLDRVETHALLKLIKLSAGFANTAYVVACDDEIVAASLGERYGAGGVAAGRQFLEKIIQVPLHLPNAEADDLRALAFEGVDEVIKHNDISLSDEEVERQTTPANGSFSLGLFENCNLRAAA